MRIKTVLELYRCDIGVSENLARASVARYPDRMGAVAEIIKIDADILNLRKKLQGKNSKELQARIDELVKKRQQFLLDLEKQARARIR